MKLDFLAIGDITTDAFIRLKDPNVHAVVDRDERELCMAFGTKIPYESVEEVPAVGNSANAAVAASRLGLSSALVTDIGDDQNGKNCLAALKKDRVETEFMRIHQGMVTNYHYVLWFEDERTILVKHQPYPYALPAVEKPKWLYVSSIGPTSEKYHDQIADYLEKNPEVRLAFQPGTFQINLGHEKLRRIYQRSEVFFCNREEAKKIVGREAEIRELAAAIRHLGPRMVAITDGPKGAYFFDEKDFWFMPPYPDPKPPYNRTGAGDAFASTLTASLALGHPVAEALRLAPVNSASVVQHVGAQKGLLTLNQIKEWLAEAPADYTPRKI